MFYVYIYFFYTIITILNHFKILNKYFHFIPLFLLIIVIFFRGYVGTDTYAYHRIVKEISSKEWNDILFIEPLFFLYSKFIYFLTNNLFITVNSFGCLTLILTFIILHRITKTYITFFLLYCPIFMLSFTMNGLREGLACTLFLISLFELKEKFKFKFFFFFILAITTHYSILYNFFLFFFINNKIQISKKTIILIFVSIAILFYSFFDILQPFFIKKFTEYSLMNTPSKFSGSSPLTIFISFYLLMFLINRKLITIYANIFFLFNLILFNYSSIIGYAALRFLWLNVFIIFTYFIFNFSFYLKNYFYKLLFLGLLGFILEMRIVLNEENNGSSFLPYKNFLNLPQYDS